jgi:DNA-binding MarR family transcriptional regulator
MVGMGKMAANQRKAAIQRMLAENPAATQQAIAEQLGVDQRTVGRDVDKLREAGVKGIPNPSGRGRPRGSVTKLPVNAVTAAIDGNSSAGEQLVARLRAELDAKGLEPDSREEGLLHQIGDVADEIAELRQLVDSEGATFPPATRGGPPRLHPAIAETRQLRSLLGRLLSQISLEESTRNPVKQKAANTRWRQHQMAAAARREGS